MSSIPLKAEKTTGSGGLPFERAADFEWETAIYDEDCRKTYPERRFIAIGHLEGVLHFICFTPIEGGARVISFRKASRKERERHEEETLYH